MPDWITELRAERDRLQSELDRQGEFLDWLISMDGPEGASERQIVTLTKIIDRAKAVREDY